MKFIAYDLGTGGVKASLYDESLQTLSKTFFEYKTFYPQQGMHEQKVSDWWAGICASTKTLLSKSGVSNSEISCVALSGHSLVAIPIDCRSKPLLQQVPIWSDVRAQKEADDFFKKIDSEKWYMTTGNGFPAQCYSIFRLMWLKKHDPSIYDKAVRFVGSKDYINLLLTGIIATDQSYASGTGAYNLLEKKMEHEFLDAAGISTDKFPEIVQSHRVIGRITKDASISTGLLEGTPVACGGVDNACMALGAVGVQEGAIYVSLGSSSWIPVNSSSPVLDYATKPYVFAHIDEKLFTSAYSIFSGGSSYQWIRQTLCKDLESDEIYKKMEELATLVPAGSNGIIFNPSLAGGTSQDKSINIRGAYFGLHLGSTREDMIRATLEGVAFNLRKSRELLSRYTSPTKRLLICGGGSKSALWMQIFADIMNCEILKSNIDQDAASLGAAAICARAMGLWPDYSKIPSLHVTERIWIPDATSSRMYEKVYPAFIRATDLAAEFGDFIAELH